MVRHTESMVNSAVRTIPGWMKRLFLDNNQHGPANIPDFATWWDITLFPLSMQRESIRCPVCDCSNTIDWLGLICYALRKSIERGRPRSGHFLWNTIHLHSRNKDCLEGLILVWQTTNMQGRWPIDGRIDLGFFIHAISLQISNKNALTKFPLLLWLGINPPTAYKSILNWTITKYIHYSDMS